MILDQEQTRPERTSTAETDAPPLLLAGEDETAAEPHIQRGID